MRMRILAATAVLFTAVCGPPALAEVQALRELFDVLRENGTITSDQYERLVRALEDGAEATGEEPREPTVKGKFPGKSYGGKARVEAAARSTERTVQAEHAEKSDADEFSLGVGGVLMTDTAKYDRDKNPLGDGTELRRARIGLDGTIFTDWDFKLSVDFADSDADIKSAYLAYNGFDFGRVTLGQFKEPFSLEETTSSRYLTFMERALPNVLSTERSIGLGVHTFGSEWTAAAGVFGEPFDKDADDEGDEGWGLTGRFTYAPFASNDRIIHLGGSASFRDPEDTAVRFRTRPESNVTNVRYVNTDFIADVDHFTRFGIEAAAVAGPFSLQGEYLRTDISRGSGSPNVDFDGWYASGSWFLTGESRRYRPDRGVFGGVIPRRKLGALELAARYSTVDLTDGWITGGEEDIITVGLNWYANPRVRIMANYLMIDNDKNANDAGTVLGNDNPNAFQMRVQGQFP